MPDFFQRGGFPQNYVSGGLSFDLDGENGQNEWPIRLGIVLIKMGCPAFVKEWSKWNKDMKGKDKYRNEKG